MRSYLRFASVIGAVTLSAIAVAPAIAAAPVSQAGANAVTVAVAGNAQGTGDVTATNDGTTEKKTGESAPQVPVPGGGFFTGGVAAQEATATAPNGAGHSAACAGLAGDGGSVVNIGESKCLSPGNQITGSLATFDPGALIDTALAPLPPELTGPLAPLTGGLDSANDAIADALSATEDQFGEMGLVSSVKVISGQCTAGPGGAEGSAHDRRRRDPGERRRSGHHAVEAPVNPPPNTHLVTDLSQVLTTVLGALRTNLNESLDGAGAALNLVLDPIQEEVVDNVVTQVEAQLAPAGGERPRHHPEQAGPSRSRRDQGQRARPPARAGGQGSARRLAGQRADRQRRLRSQRSGHPAAAAPEAAAPALPTAVSAGYESMPGQHAPGDDSHNGFVVAALAIMAAGWHRARGRPPALRLSGLGDEQVRLQGQRLRARACWCCARWRSASAT